MPDVARGMGVYWGAVCYGAVGTGFGIFGDATDQAEAHLLNAAAGEVRFSTLVYSSELCPVCSHQSCSVYRSSSDVGPSHVAFLRARERTGKVGSRPHVSRTLPAFWFTC